MVEPLLEPDAPDPIPDMSHLFLSDIYRGNDVAHVVSLPTLEECEWNESGGKMDRDCGANGKPKRFVLIEAQS
jgi:hypothetical protein